MSDCDDISEYLIDITTNAAQSSRLSSGDGTILIRPFPPESVTMPPFQSLDPPPASNSDSPPESNPPPDVLQQDPDDSLATDDSDAELWLD